MKELTPEEMLVLIKELTRKHDITAYEIGENTDLNTSGVHRILSGQVPKPRIKTLKTILEYIEDKILGSSNKKTRATEEKALAAGQLSIQKIIAQEVCDILEPRMAEFKEYHHAIMRALASQALDLEDFRNYIEKLDFSTRSNKN